MVQIQPGTVELSPRVDLIKAKWALPVAAEAPAGMMGRTSASSTLQYELHQLHHSSDVQWQQPRSRSPGVQGSAGSTHGRRPSRLHHSSASDLRTASMTVRPDCLQTP